MLEDVAAYLVLGPIAATLALLAVGVWLALSRPAPARVRMRAFRRRP